MHKTPNHMVTSQNTFTCILYIHSKISLQIYIFPWRRWEGARAMKQPVQHDKNKPSLRGGEKKKSLRLLAAHTNVLRSNLSGVLFASYFNKGAQWVYQTALMKGLLAGLPAADPLDPECVFTINPPLCLQQATSSPPLLPNASPLTHTQTATFTGVSPQPPDTPPPPPLCLPQNLSSITPQVLHTYLHTEHTALAPK